MTLYIKAYEFNFVYDLHILNIQSMEEKFRFPMNKKKKKGEKKIKTRYNYWL